MTARERARLARAIEKTATLHALRMQDMADDIVAVEGHEGAVLWLSAHIGRLQSRVELLSRHVARLERRARRANP